MQDADALTIRDEQAGDAAAVAHVNREAFGGPAEAEIVARLHAAGAVTLALVACAGDHVVGHVLFSPDAIATAAGERAAVGLAPMAVLPAQQRRGIGTRLVQAGLARLRAAGHEAVVVLGHPAYYPRFGFTRASAFGLRCAFACPDEAFLALELRPGALAGGEGVVRYRPELGA